jgi:hypothetical protein
MRTAASDLAIGPQQPRPRQPRLDAIAAPAIARAPCRQTAARPAEQVVPPLAGNRVRPGEQPAADADAAAHPGTENHAEHRRSARRGAIGGFGQRETVGVVGDAHFAPQPRAQVLAQPLAVEPGGIAVAHAPRHRRGRARRAHAHAATLAQPGLDAPHQRGDGVERLRIGGLRRRHAFAPQHGAGGIERDAFDLGAAEVDADADHRGRNLRRSSPARR